ncbi:hyaluronidase PH-20-like [Thunnus maccoyii]|uniref:hyaluronidase PH-20-like n=1 Tax=Thunnus maccoyii TaxID=8240 RepID=UPI001C4ACB8F|nr:hyaluronidase PH-20-like [Thunnus maccoyii]
MVSVTRKSRSCVLLYLSLISSILAPLPLAIFPAFTVSVSPVFSLSVLRTTKATPPPVINPNMSIISETFTTPSILKSSTPTITSTSLFNQTSTTDLLTTSPTASTKSFFLQLGKKYSLSSGPVQCSFISGLRTLKFFSPNIPKLLPHLCKCLTTSFKTMVPPLHKKLPSPWSKMCLYPASLYPAKPYKFTNTSLLHKKLSSPSQTASPSPPTTSLSPAAFLSLTPKTSPPPFAKVAHIPILKSLPLPPESTSSHKPRLRPPPPPPPLPHTTGPLFEHQPFIVSWNIPDLVCNRHNISLDTSPFKGVATPAKVPGQFLSLFYTDRLGLYPHVNLTSKKQLNGGIPQRGNLEASLNKARADINYYIPSKTSRGLAVIDWEEWRPLWDRNWGTKRVYQNLSVARIMQTNPFFTLRQATEKAKKQFQVAARNFMSGMLAVGRAMRPNYLWGFYLFPNCYNYGWKKPDYTGHCSKEVRRQNDELLWLWKSSTALYPSVYLQLSLADNLKAALMVRNRVQEALRVSASPRRTGTAPVFVYTRPVFVDRNKRFLSQGDLVSTIGESAAVGASGAVLWGASADYDDQTSCKALSSYLSSTLNPYITNVTVAAQLCSNFLCQGNGRCVRKNYNSSYYLHLNPENFKVLHVQNRYLVLGRPTFTDLKTFSKRFTCQCYKGLNCTPRTYRELAKALIFSVQHGLHTKYQKAYTLNKAVLDDTQQTSISKDNVKKNLKV